MANSITGTLKGTGNWRTSPKGTATIPLVGKAGNLPTTIDPATVIHVPKGQRRQDNIRRAAKREADRLTAKRASKHRNKHYR